MTRDTGEHKGEGRGWRRLVLTASRRKMLRKLRDGQEWDALSLSAASGVAYATVYQSLKAFKDLGLATERVESVREHRAREKREGAVNKGPRRTVWKLTGKGMQTARDA